MPKPKNQTQQTEEKNIQRPPVVVIMGHIDHGKSTLLDFIRKSNIVSGEAGGITQHLGAYEIVHKQKESGLDKNITFLDTPGHEAFVGVRSRGAKVADIAILIVSAEDGVKPQTLEALECIKKDSLPYIVAINKIDSPKADIGRTKNSLVENEIYIEGFGGDIPVVEISAKNGDNIEDLLETILLVAELEDFKMNLNENASGFIVESKKDKHKGISTTLVIKNGCMKIGQFVATENAYSPIRAIEDQNNARLKTAQASSPVHIHGWNDIPNVGSAFKIFDNKKQAENYISEWKELEQQEGEANGYVSKKDTTIIPVLVKADNHGSLEAIEYELSKIKLENAEIKIIHKGTGHIGEADIKAAISDENTIIAGFGVDIDKSATAMIDRVGVEVRTFKIIYELIDWLKVEIEAKRPRQTVEEIIGQAKILRVFNKTKHLQVLGGKVKEGSIKKINKVKIMRRDEEIGTGIIKELQQAKTKAEEVSEENEFGVAIDSKVEIMPGDFIKSVELKEK